MAERRLALLEQPLHGSVHFDLGAAEQLNRQLDEQRHQAVRSWRYSIAAVERYSEACAKSEAALAVQ